MKRYTVTIPAGRTARIERSGDTLLISRSSFPFRIQRNDGATDDAESGYRLARPFASLIFENPNTLRALSVTYYIGTGGLDLASYQDPPTFVRCGVATIANGQQSTDYLFQDPNGARRKWLIIENQAASGALKVTAQQGTGSAPFVGIRVRAGDFLPLYTDDEIVVRNESGGSINIAWTAAFYL